MDERTLHHRPLLGYRPGAAAFLPPVLVLAQGTDRQHQDAQLHTPLACGPRKQSKDGRKKGERTMEMDEVRKEGGRKDGRKEGR